MPTLVLALLSGALAASPGSRVAASDGCAPPGLSTLREWQAPPLPPEFQQNAQTVTLLADSQRKMGDSYQLHGHVVVSYRDLQLTADDVTYNDMTGEAVARGHVTLVDQRAHLHADEAHYNVETARGWLTHARGYVHAAVRARPRMLITENPFYLRAERVDKVDENVYTLERGRVTACEDEKRGWSVAARYARLEPGNRVITRGDVFHLLGVPIFYAPVLVDSLARNPRQTGFLLPEIGNSGQKGWILGDAFFWAINPSADLLLGLENYSLRGLARIGRLRARPSKDSDLTVNYFGINDRGIGAGRLLRAPGDSVRATGHDDNLGGGFRGVLDVDYINSLAFRLTFTDNFTQAVTSEARQEGFVSKDFASYTLGVYASRYQDFLCAALPGQTCPAVPGGAAGKSIVIRQAPSFSFAGMDQQVGSSPFYFAVDASADGVARIEPGFSTPDISERLDAHPQVTLRTRPLLGFYFTPTLGMELTRYGTSLKPNGDPLTRWLGEFSFDLRPPSFERVFAQPYRHHRFKHVLEPDIRYDLVRAHNPEEVLDIVRFDQVDIRAETNEIEYSLTNTLFMRKDPPDTPGEMPQARELLSLRLTQKYYFDPTFGGALLPGQKIVWDPTVSLTGFAFAEGRRLSPVVSVLKFSPFSNYDTEVRADFSPNGGGVLNAGITSRVKSGPWGVGVTDFFINRTAAGLITPPSAGASPATPPSFNLLRTVVSYGEINRKGLSAALGLDYNLAQGLANSVVSQASYNFGCFALDFEYRRFALGVLRRENQFRIALSLANVGSVGNLRPRERLY